jgi:hypothetical protein
MFDNVYSDKPAETSIKAPIPELRTEEVLRFRQSLKRLWGVWLEYALLVFLLTETKRRRWNLEAFVLYVAREHTISRYTKGPAVGVRDVMSKYSNPAYNARGPVLESYPPEKRVPRAVAPDPSSESAISDLPAESPPVAKPQRVMQSTHAPPGGALANADRVLEILVERGHDGDAGFLAWLEKHKPIEWPTNESRVVREIERYERRNVDRNRASASSDAASSIRASSDVSGEISGGLTTPVSDADLSPGDKSGVHRVWSGGSPGDPAG